MYEMLLESVQHFLTKKFGEAKWKEIRERAGICNHMFITHKQYSESLMTKIADTAAEILGEDTDMLSDDFMQYFGTCFVKFFWSLWIRSCHQSKRPMSPGFSDRN